MQESEQSSPRTGRNSADEARILRKSEQDCPRRGTEMAGKRTRFSETRTVLANQRTDLAESRTGFSRYRSVMAKGRTELAFIRTGVAFVALGLGMMRYFGFGPWTILDAGIASLGRGFDPLRYLSLHDHAEVPALLRAQDERVFCLCTPNDGKRITKRSLI